eukprot:3138380-Rhodomonas_salina.2
MPAAAVTKKLRQSRPAISMHVLKALGTDRPCVDDAEEASALPPSAISAPDIAYHACGQLPEPVWDARFQSIHFASEVA